MFEEIREDIDEFSKKVAVWVTGKGFSMGLVAAAVHGFGNAQLIPIISLPIAAGIASLNSNISHGQAEKKILNAYRKEISAFLDIEPTRVSIEHLHLVANGNTTLGIPSNHIIKEAIERNDQVRGANVFGHLAAMAVSIGVVMSVIAGGGGLLATAVTAMGGTYAGLTATLSVAGLSAITSFAFDLAANHLTLDYLGLNKPVANDRIKEMRNEIADGKEISKERIFSLFVEANPSVAKHIEETFGAKYDVLPSSAQMLVTDHYDAQFHISNISELVNSQRMDVTELAFAAQGMASGVQARAPHQEPEHTNAPAAQTFATKAVGSSITATHEAGIGKAPNATDISETKTMTMKERSSSFAERFEKKHQNSSYAEMVKRKAFTDIQKEDAHDAKTALGQELLSDFADIAMSI